MQTSAEVHATHLPVHFFIHYGLGFCFVLFLVRSDATGSSGPESADGGSKTPGQDGGEHQRSRQHWPDLSLHRCVPGQSSVLSALGQSAQSTRSVLSTANATYQVGFERY